MARILGQGRFMLHIILMELKAKDRTSRDGEATEETRIGEKKFLVAPSPSTAALRTSENWLSE